MIIYERNLRPQY